MHGVNPDTVVQHFDRLERALALEAEASRHEQPLAQLSDRQLRASGLGLAGLHVLGEEPGFGDRRYLSLDTSGLGRLGLRVGQPVRLWPCGERDSSGVPGVVIRRGPPLGVDIDPEAEVPATKLRIEPAPDETTSLRIRADLRRARETASPLRDVLLGHKTPRQALYEGWLPVGLDPHQERAARHALGALDVALIHGPPGTGKTRTVAAAISAAVRAGERVLVFAPSHTAVDNLASRLVAYGLNIVRLGHPARVASELLAHTLEHQLERHERVRLARRYRREAAARFRQADRFTRAKPAPGEKATARREARALRADAKKLEIQAASDLIDGAEVVLASLGVDPRLLGARTFDRVFVDEAGQATEASTWRAAVRGTRLVLAGDHRQLPPTVKSPAAQDAGLGMSLFERMMKQAPEAGARLNRQYRMHAEIMHFPSASMYDGTLEAAPEVAEHRLVDLDGIQACEATETPFRWVDTAGAGFDETAPDGEGPGWLNAREAELVARVVQEWLDAGLPAAGIGIITPYAAQAQLLEDQLQALGVEIDTVDGFQGREKEAIAISLVRSNPEAKVGFLAEHRRMNVALTRARRSLLVVGDGATLGGDPYFGQLLTFAQEAGRLSSVWEIPGAV